MLDIEKIKLDLCNNLSKSRYLHSIRVADEALKLAKYYGLDVENAYLAGVLHDIAKEYDYDKNREYILKYGLSIDLLDNSRICHAEVGALVAMELYYINEDIVNAIKYHTIGNINMNDLAKIVFIADKIESGKDYLGIDEERELAYVNIDLAMIKCIENTRLKLMNDGKDLNVETVRLLDSLKSKVKDLY